MKAKTFAVIGLGVALIISILAPFLASSNPDGLESAAEKFREAEGRDYQAFGSPFSDYIIPSFGESKFSGVVAILIGTLITFGLGYVIAKAVK